LPAFILTFNQIDITNIYSLYREEINSFIDQNSTSTNNEKGINNNTSIARNLIRRFNPREVIADNEILIQNRYEAVETQQEENSFSIDFRNSENSNSNDSISLS
jgi:hypothetical protein